MEIASPPHTSEDQSAFDPTPLCQEDRLRTDAVRPAGFIRRAIAYTIDAVIIVVLFQFFLFAGSMGLLLSSGAEINLALSRLGGTLFSGFFFIYIGYFTFFHTHGGQTPAKMILRIKVVTATLETPLPFQAFMRSLGYLVSSLFLGLGFFITVFERKKRALHDLLANTQVILSE